MRAIIVIALFVALISPVSASLVAYYPFNGDVKDFSGNDNHGKMFGGRFVDGIDGKGIYLNGMGDYVQVHDSPYFHGLNELSIIVWIETSKTPGTIVSKESNGVYTGFELRIDPEGQIEFKVGREQAYSPIGVASRKKVNDGKWHQIAVVYRGDVMRIYIDGKLDSSSSSTYYTVLDNTRPLVIGKTLYSGGRGFKGVIDELRVYNHAISLSEIQKNYLSVNPEKKVNPKKTQTPVSTPATVPTLTPVTSPQPGSENPSSVNLSPDDFRIPLDLKIEKIDEVLIGGKVYEVYRYKNLLPYASRIVVLSRNGIVEDRDIVEDVLSTLAWKEASKKISQEDIETIRNIGKLSQEMVNVLSPVEAILSGVLDGIGKMKSYCIDIRIARKCAWDVITAAYPEMSSLETSLRSLDREIGEWLSASSMVSKEAPVVAQALESAKMGNELPDTIQEDISSLISAFMRLEGKTSEFSSALRSVSDTLTSAGRNIISKSGVPLIGDAIRSFGELLVNAGNSIGGVKKNIDSLSAEMTRLSERLSSVRNEAQARSDQFMSEWEKGINAESKVYGTITGLPVLILGIFALGRMKKRLSKGPDVSKRESDLPQDVIELNKITEMIANLEKAKNSGEIDNEVYMELKNEYENKRRAVTKKMEDDLKKLLKEHKAISGEIDRINKELSKLRGRFSVGEINKKMYKKRKKEIESVLEEKKKKKASIEESINHRKQALQGYGE